MRTPTSRKALDEKVKEYKERGICPFCKEGLKDQKIIRELNDIVVIENMFPYERKYDLKVEKHLLIIPKRHVQSIAELTKDEYRAMLDMESEYTPEITIQTGKKDTTRSVPQHLHRHIINPT